MNPVNDFAIKLAAKSKHRYARWHKIDLHNHTPESYDYQYFGDDVVERTAEQIITCNLSVVMFTDHEKLPSEVFTSAIQAILHTRGHKALILRGVELNVFVEGFNSDEKGYSDSRCFYHMLVGFDPNNSRTPDYWLENIYQKCGEVTYEFGSQKFKGISYPIPSLRESLKGSNALIIPAHLHTNSRDLSKSRSVDVLYDDKTFLKHAQDNFTALEVVDPKTAQFFDGKHNETDSLLKTCIRSSDSHTPDTLGQRYCYAQMQDLTYDDLKAALELRSRISLDPPQEPDGFVVGLHIEGAFLSDLWIEFSPHCNMLIGVKGSGKTSVLEALRFVLGAEVPESLT